MNREMASRYPHENDRSMCIESSDSLSRKLSVVHVRNESDKQSQNENFKCEDDDCSLQSSDSFGSDNFLIEKISKYTGELSTVYRCTDDFMLGNDKADLKFCDTTLDHDITKYLHTEKRDIANTYHHKSIFVSSDENEECLDFRGFPEESVSNDTYSENFVSAKNVCFDSLISNETDSEDCVSEDDKTQYSVTFSIKQLDCDNETVPILVLPTSGGRKQSSKKSSALSTKHSSKVSKKKGVISALPKRIGTFDNKVTHYSIGRGHSIPTHLTDVHVILKKLESVERYPRENDRSMCIESSDSLSRKLSVVHVRNESDKQSQNENFKCEDDDCSLQSSDSFGSDNFLIEKISKDTGELSTVYRCTDDFMLGNDKADLKFCDTTLDHDITKYLHTEKVDIANTYHHKSIFVSSDENEECLDFRGFPEESVSNDTYSENFVSAKNVCFDSLISNETDSEDCVSEDDKTQYSVTFSIKQLDCDNETVPILVLPTSGGRKQSSKKSSALSTKHSSKVSKKKGVISALPKRIGTFDNKVTHYSIGRGHSIPTHLTDVHVILKKLESVERYPRENDRSMCIESSDSLSRKLSVVHVRNESDKQSQNENFKCEDDDCSLQSSDSFGSDNFLIEKISKDTGELSTVYRCTDDFMLGNDKADLKFCDTTLDHDITKYLHTEKVDIANTYHHKSIFVSSDENEECLDFRGFPEESVSNDTYSENFVSAKNVCFDSLISNETDSEDCVSEDDKTQYSVTFSIKQLDCDNETVPILVLPTSGGRKQSSKKSSALSTKHSSKVSKKKGVISALPKSISNCCKEGMFSLAPGHSIPKHLTDVRVILTKLNSVGISSELGTHEKTEERIVNTANHNSSPSTSNVKSLEQVESQDVDDSKDFSISHLTSEDLSARFDQNVIYLTEIFEGTRPCVRRDKYQDGLLRGIERNISFGAVPFNSDQLDHVATLLEHSFLQEEDGIDLKTRDYLMSVLVPETCIKIFMDEFALSRQAAVNAIRKYFVSSDRPLPL